MDVFTPGDHGSTFGGNSIAPPTARRSTCRAPPAQLCAFDLLELSGTEVRKQPLVERKELLADFLSKVKDGIDFNDHIEGVAGHVVFDHACKLGHEGIVVKRKDLPYESGRSKRWSKIKNPDSAAMKRVDEGGF
jgi:ATP-dependent DNA ligase